MRWLLALTILGCGATPDATPDAGHTPPPRQTELRAAAVTVDVTPEPGVEIVGFGRRTSTAVRDPLFGAVLVVASPSGVVAIVTLDVPGIFEWHAQLIRGQVAAAVGVGVEQVVVAASHTHSAPMLGDDAWSRRTMDALADAARRARETLAPAWLGVGRAEVGFCVNRRLAVDGVVRAAPNPEGPVDPRIRVLRLATPEGAPIATVTHAVCHPNLLLGAESTAISADFPGEARARLDDPWLFLPGAAGDVRPLTVDAEGEFRLATDAEVRDVGRTLAEATEAAPAAPAPVHGDAIDSATTRLDLTRRDDRPMSVELSAHRVGDVTLVTIPGEPFVDIGLAVERRVLAEGLAGEVIVIGYANGYADYIVTPEAEPLGGYEVERSLLPPTAAAEIEDALVALARQVAP